MSLPTLPAQVVAAPFDARVPDWARAVGVTRVARVTDLDRLGVEVACAIRPTGTVLQVSVGKGDTFEKAKRSALSEALELHACEHLVPERITLARARFGGPREFWSQAVLDGRPENDFTTIQPWLVGERLDRAGEVLVPASRVYCPAAAGELVGLRAAPWTANGLGAHPKRSEARWHGLLELLEREAICRIFPEGWTDEHLKKLSLSFDAPDVTHVRSLGVKVHVIDATPDDWPIPVIAVLLVDTDSRAPTLAAGYACRRSPEDAARAAFEEACQSRLTEIHGAREDVAQELVMAPRWTLRSPRRTEPLSALPTWRGPISRLLRAMGLAAAAVDVTPDGSPIAVERVFVPGFRISELLV